MKDKISLRDRLYKYLLKQHGWVASGDLQRLVVAHTDYTPRTAVRRLEEMAEAGTLRVEYRKGHAFYSAQKSTTPILSNRERAAKMVALFDAGKSSQEIFSIA